LSTEVAIKHINKLKRLLTSSLHSLT